ncbi:glycosyl hydrolase [Serinibacter arcticus]|uniref:Exo-alpha-(1->6)-L-arabinopyranosidase n=1 Tax=Serinibacter arcticus TaxID=1655435 RepID=A0A2U1ZXL0_9MICO|nr:glycoside hydrolase family 3 N-terminal domain-containing protein [Serinibacter arcticus]PWD51673.1 glycosyl hydrolase [Serinibacter arcticus]
MTAPTSRSPLATEQLIASLTLEEKASLLSGHDFWHTTAIERDGVSVPSMMLTDGPHGLRKQLAAGDHLGLASSVPATCFPTASALGSTWDPELLTRVGAALGLETRAADVSVILGPGANIKRDPRCGRNFEYLSEDPVLSGDLAAALIAGIQSQGVGTSLKHFAVNNQESDRMRVSADVDERPLREIYLASFERAVTKADPWTVMCAYNKVNGVYASQKRFLLTQVLREEWGWDGLVVSDWGAVRDRVAALEAGLDLEMPASDGRTDAAVVAAVRAGTLDEAHVDAAVRNVLRLVDRTADAVATPATVDVAAHHALAREAAAASAVLLRNEPVDGAPLLPLQPASSANGADGAGVVAIGEFARTPRYQGAGSSLVTPTQLDDALGALEAALGAPVPFAPGFTIPEGPDSALDGDALLAEAVALAEGAGTVLAFLGLPAVDESEGYDRTTISLPAAQLRVLEAVAAVNPRVVVVLSNGGAVSVSEWQQHAPAILESWLGGQAGASGAVDVLTGAVSPSGKLAETLPVRLQDVPAYGSFPGELGHVTYGEGLFVGYRWYDARDVAVAHPFGFGLSYTTFAIDGVTASVTGSGAEARVAVSATVTNTGDRAGAEVVQVYVSDPAAVVTRPERELKAFAKVALEPGEARTVTFDLDSRALAFWHPALHRWTVEGGEFVVSVGTSSRDLAASVSLDVVGEDVSAPLTEMSTLAELLADPVAEPEVRPMTADMDPALLSMADDMPAIVLADFGMTPLTHVGLADLIERSNAARG